jgi:hypothetical protein
MQVRYIFSALLAALAYIPTTAFADLPLTVEELLTAQNRWRSELGINYANAEAQGISAGQAVAVQVSPTQFVAIPTQISASRFNTDTVVISPGLRYGISANTEAYAHATWYNSTTRMQDLSGMSSQSSSRFDSLWLGINHKLIEEGKSPSVLGFVEIALAEKSQLPAATGTRMANGKSALIGATTYRVFDPIVLALTAAYHLNVPRTISGESYLPGNYLMLNPTMSFAVNNDISLSAGIQWRNVRADRLNGQAQSLFRTSTDLNLGMAFQWSERSTLNFSSTANLSGRGGAGFGLTWSSKLGELPPRKLPSKTVSP